MSISQLIPSLTSAEEEHSHRWRIAEQGGASSAGRCDCGLERDFQNGWEGDSGFQLSGSWLNRRDRQAEAGR